MKKLSLIQSELKVGKTRFNKFGNFNYRSCEDIFDAIKPLLEKHKCSLVVTDTIEAVGNIIYVNATATLTDEESKDFTKVSAQAGIEPRKGMDIAQSFGASSSYARKYALSGMFLLDDVNDPDTFEGGKHPQPAIKANVPPSPPSPPSSPSPQTPPAAPAPPTTSAPPAPTKTIVSDNPEALYNAIMKTATKAELRELYKANKALFDSNQSIYNAMITRSKDLMP